MVGWDTQERLGHSLNGVGGVGRRPVAGGGSTEAGSILHQTDGWRAGTGCEIQGHAGPGNKGATERIKSIWFRKSQVTGRINGKGSQGRSCGGGRRRKVGQ